MLRTALVFSALLWTAEFAVAADQPKYPDGWLSLVPGRFVLIGRLPDNGATYSGTAVISETGQGFTLKRTVGTRSFTAKGTIEVPSPPGEGKVLRFRWNDHGLLQMTCLVQSDLDNYARLSCLWVMAGHEHKAPGLETYFSTEVWPENAPSSAPGGTR